MSVLDLILDDTLTDASIEDCLEKYTEESNLSFNSDSLPDASLEVLDDCDSLPDASPEKLVIQADCESLPDASPAKCLAMPPQRRRLCFNTASTVISEPPQKKLKPTLSSTPKSLAKRKQPASKIISSKQDQSLGTSSASSKDDSTIDLDTSANDEFEDSTKNASWKLTSILKFNGCAPECAKTLHQLNEHEILNAHAIFSALSGQQKNEWLAKYFIFHCPCDSNGKKDVKNIQFLIHGKEVCNSLWLEVLSLSASRFYRVRKDFLTQNGANFLVKCTNKHKQKKTVEACAWLTSYIQRVGDKRPDKDWIFLPTCLTEAKMYEIMLDELYSQSDDSSHISYSKFCQIFKEEFKNVSIPKSCRFTKCDMCTLLKLEMVKPQCSSAEKKALNDLLLEHIRLQDEQRQRYAVNCELATRNPAEYLSLIVDGMDQNKTNVPNLVKKTKSCQNLWTLRTHLTGVLVHGTGNFCYYDFLQFSHDCNLTIICILFTLLEISNQRSLPPKLLVQMDNCVRENKNKFVFGFMALLVEMNIFSEIELGFLMVGHTHADVDQSFSCLSKYLQKNSSFTMEDLITATKVSNSNVVDVQVLRYLFNIREWISPCLEVIKYHTEPHVFNFHKNSKGQTAMYYKPWAKSNWLPNSDGLLILKSVPSSKPDLVVPSLGKQDIGQMMKDVPKYHSTGIFPPDTKDKWNLFLSSFNTKYGIVPSVKPKWILDDFKPLSERRLITVNPPLPEHVVQKSISSKSVREIEIGKRSKKSGAPQASQQECSGQEPLRPGRRSKKSGPATTIQQKCRGQEPQRPGRRSQKSGAATTSLQEPCSGQELRAAPNCEHHCSDQEPSSGQQFRTSPDFQPGDFIALACEKYKEFLPNIGRLIKLNETKVNVEWLEGDYDEQLTFWKGYRGRIITEEVPLRSVLCKVSLTASMTLSKCQVKTLKEKYAVAEFV